DTKDQVERILRRNPDLFLVGKEEGKIVAVVIGAWDGRRAYVHHLAVDPSHQRKGYGKELMLELHKRFLEQDFHKAHLFIEIDNDGVIEFYKKLGWFVRDDLMMMSYIPKEHENKKRVENVTM
ncbi:MAG: GNAT family N-acetyltransferase, partial [Candidatus Heimdallarchaeaceae archaeon]